MHATVPVARVSLVVLVLLGEVSVLPAMVLVRVFAIFFVTGKL